MERNIIDNILDDALLTIEIKKSDKILFITDVDITIKNIKADFTEFNPMLNNFSDYLTLNSLLLNNFFSKCILNYSIFGKKNRLWRSILKMISSIDDIYIVISKKDIQLKKEIMLLKNHYEIKQMKIIVL